MTIEEAITVIEDEILDYDTRRFAPDYDREYKAHWMALAALREKAAPKIKGVCGDCAKHMTQKCLMCSFEFFEGYEGAESAVVCTSGPDSDFYCAAWSESGAGE